MLRLGDFMICNAFSNIPSEESISQIWNFVVHISDLEHCRKIKFNIRYMFIIPSYTQIVTNVTLELFSCG